MGEGEKKKRSNPRDLRRSSKKFHRIKEDPVSTLNLSSQADRSQLMSKHALIKNTEGFLQILV